MNTKKRRTIQLSNGYLFSSILVLSACQGSWAQQTQINLNPVGRSVVKGLVLVSQGRHCDDQGVCRPEGSDVRWQLTSDGPSAKYSIVAAKGTCISAPNGSALDTSRGDTLNQSGSFGHIDIPIMKFTSGDYVFVVRAGKHVVACGVIRRGGPV